MKLYHSPTSPYVRKVMACAIARGIEDRIQTLETNPHESPAALLRENPLSKVPCLVTEDGLALFDSPVICEYLDSVGDVNALFPPAGAARWRALRFQAMGDGIMDATVVRRLAQARPRDASRDAVIARQEAAIMRTLDVLEADPPANHLDVGTIAAAARSAISTCGSRRAGGARGGPSSRTGTTAWRRGRNWPERHRPRERERVARISPLTSA